jgi:tetratricopeptide (TPR) repeat protein
MKGVKRFWILVGLAGAAMVAVALQQVQKDRQYRGLLATGEQQLAAHDTSAAIEAFSGALALRPDSMVSHFRRGAAYRAQGQREDAIRDLREAIRLAPDATAPFVALGDLYDAEGDWVRAADAYDEAASRLKDQDPALLYKLALARYRAGAPALAIAPLQRAVARDDSMGEAHYLLGLAYRDTQRGDEAVAALERAVRVAPSLVPAREELADLYRARQRQVDEMAQLQALAALASDDTRPARQVAVGLALARGGQFDAAVAAIADAAARAPSNVRVQLALARAYLGRAERSPDRTSLRHAIDALDRALAGSTDRSEALTLMGHARFLSGDYGAAERTLAEAVTTSPVYTEAFAFLADAAERLGHDLEARDALANLDALQGDTATAPQRAARAGRLGAISLRVNEPKTAAMYLTRAVESGLGDAATFGLLARARWQAGDRAGASAALARGLALDPNSQELVQLSRSIR